MTGQWPPQVHSIASREAPLRPMAALTTAAEQGSTTVKTASMDEIRKHAADARWLDALDALDALSADEIDDEALAAEVEAPSASGSGAGGSGCEDSPSSPSHRRPRDCARRGGDGVSLMMTACCGSAAGTHGRRGPLPHGGRAARPRCSAWIPFLHICQGPGLCTCTCTLRAGSTTRCILYVFRLTYPCNRALSASLFSLTLSLSLAVSRHGAAMHAASIRAAGGHTRWSSSSIVKSGMWFMSQFSL